MDSAMYTPFLFLSMSMSIPVKPNNAVLLSYPSFEEVQPARRHLALPPSHSRQGMTDTMAHHSMQDTVVRHDAVKNAALNRTACPKWFRRPAGPRLMAITLLGVFSTIAVAEDIEMDVRGSIQATVGEQSGEWVTIAGTLQGESGSSAELSSMALNEHMTQWSLRVQGHDPESDNILRENVLSINVYLGMGDDPLEMASSPDSTEIMLFVEGGPMSGTLYGGEGSDVEVTIEDFEFDGEQGHTRGHFSGELCFLDMSDMAAGHDEDNCIHAEGEFDTQLAHDHTDV